MTSKAKMIVVAAFAVIALSATTAGSAPAAEWHVNGSVLTGSEPVLPLYFLLVPPLFFIPALKIKLTCKGSMLNSISPQLLAKNSFSATSLTFEECETTEPAANCALEPVKQNISTNPTTASAVSGPAPSVRITFSPKTKTTLTQIQFNEADTCAFNGLEPVTGKVTFNAPTGGSELSLQTIEGLGSVENNSLQINGNAAFIEKGKVLVSVTKMQPWSFR